MSMSVLTKIDDRQTNVFPLTITWIEFCKAFVLRMGEERKQSLPRTNKYKINMFLYHCCGGQCRTLYCV